LASLITDHGKEKDEGERTKEKEKEGRWKKEDNGWMDYNLYTAPAPTNVRTTIINP
jgi:hypothetical protein